jgi:hypothetical protein
VFYETDVLPVDERVGVIGGLSLRQARGGELRGEGRAGCELLESSEGSQGVT